MKPTIYLGLGGTGNLAISFAKRLYEEEYGKGNIPSSVAFVTVDFQTDMDKDPGLATDISDDFIKIEVVTNPREFYKVQRESYGNYTWMFEGNKVNIANRVDRGAGQVRTTGRLYTEMSLDSVMNRLENVVNRVRFVENDANAAGGFDLFMVMSIAGGTGSGSFISLAAEIRDRYRNEVNLQGYAVSHSVFKAMDVTGVKVPNVANNAISAIMDLDYILTKTSTTPVQLNVGFKKIELNDYLFNNFFVIDNANESGYVVNDVKALCEVVGIFLYTYSAFDSQKIENILNNISYTGGRYDVGVKSGWVSGLGACHVVYKGQLLAKTYGLKAAMELIRKLRQEDADMQAKALAWTQEVGIREDGNEYNLLIDSIYSPKQIQSLRDPMLDQQNTDAANLDCVKKYFATLVEFPSEEVLANRTGELKKALSDKIENFLKAENGVGNSLSFLRALHKLCSKYKMEMTDEAIALKKEKEERLEVFEQRAFRDYNDQKYGVLAIRRKEKNQELLEEVVGRPAKEIVKLSHDAKRREAARDIFVALIAKIEMMLQTLTELDQKLNNLSEEYGYELADIQGMNSDALVFEYDLSYNDRINMTVDKDNVVVADFIRTLDKSLSEVDLHEELEKKILEYTTNLPQANDYRNRLLTKVIDNMSDKEYAKLQDEILKKSSRWLRVNGRGQRVNSDGRLVEDAIGKNFLIYLYSEEREDSKNRTKSRIEADQKFIPSIVSKEFLAVNKEMFKQRMMFCRCDGSIIPYCIDAFNDMLVNKYNITINKVKSGENMFNPHFDRHIFEKMREEDFKLKPEMKNEAIFYWVCGQFFGWESITEDERIMNKDENGKVLSESSKESAEHTKYICCLRKKYMYWDVNAPAGKDRQWISLDNTSRRDSAYNYFKTMILPEYKETFKELISQKYSMNKTYWNSKIQSVADAGFEDYIDRVVCSDKSSVTYFSNNSGETKQLQEEFQYIKKDLLNTLANFR